MSNDYDEFQDVRDANRGIFSDGLGAIDDGFRAHNRVNYSLSQEGLVCELPCGGCGLPYQMMVEWPELVALRVGISPYHAYGAVPQWRQWAAPWSLAPERRVQEAGGRGTYWMTEGLKCKCGAMIEVMVSPEEATSYLRKARSKNWLSKQDELALGTHCTRMVRGGR